MTPTAPPHPRPRLPHHRRTSRTHCALWPGPRSAQAAQRGGLVTSEPARATGTSLHVPQRKVVLVGSFRPSPERNTQLLVTWGGIKPPVCTVGLALHEDRVCSLAGRHCCPGPPTGAAGRGPAASLTENKALRPPLTATKLLTSQRRESRDSDAPLSTQRCAAPDVGRRPAGNHGGGDQFQPARVAALRANKCSSRIASSGAQFD